MNQLVAKQSFLPVELSQPDPDNHLEVVKKELLNSKIARLVYDMRIQAELSFEQLAGLTGIAQKDLVQLEHAIYLGDAPDLMMKVATILGYDVAKRGVGGNKLE